MYTPHVWPDPRFYGIMLILISQNCNPFLLKLFVRFFIHTMKHTHSGLLPDQAVIKPSKETL